MTSIVRTSDARSPRQLLDRLLAAPQVAEAIVRLPPAVLHRIIEHCGLEDCGELLALAAPEQLARVLDLDLWPARGPGLDERFDADRFGVWLEVLVDSGAVSAATALAAVDARLVSMALAQHVLVFDPAAVAPMVSADGDAVPAIHAFDDRLHCQIGGYQVVAWQAASWEAITAALGALEAEHAARFDEIMRGCRQLSSSLPEVDGLDDLLTDADQIAFDLAVERERRRDAEGYVTPAQARAFLEMARRTDRRPGAQPPTSPVAAAYFRAIEPIDVPADTPSSMAGVVEALLEAGVLPQPVRALLDDPRAGGSPLSCIHQQMQFVRDVDAVVYSTRNHELAYLANTIAAGCSIQGRLIDAQEASTAAVAVCNLGLENWPAPRHLAGAPRGSVTTLPADFLVHHDLVGAFEIGWAVLHEDVCMYAAEHLIAALGEARSADRDVQQALTALRRALTKHWRAGRPWAAHEALEVIAMLDAPAWAALLGLISEFPVLHAAVGASLSHGTHRVSAAAFEFISETGQIQAVRDFMGALPDLLRG